jgi:hypothetical protein
MKRGGPLKRKTPLRPKRKRTRRGQPTPEEKAAIRLAVYERARGRCELNLGPKCIKGVLPFTGDIFERWHLVHIHAKRRFGWGLDNLCGGCFWCHTDSHNAGGKPIPAKVKE